MDSLLKASAAAFAEIAGDIPCLQAQNHYMSSRNSWFKMLPGDG